MNLRAFLVLFYVTSFIFVTTPERRRLRELAKTDPQECSRIAHLQVKKAFRNMLRIAGVKIEVSGLDNIPDEPCLYVANHNSYVDILVTETVIPTGAGFVSKDSLQKIPGLSSWMYLIHCLFLNRTGWNLKKAAPGNRCCVSGSDIHSRAGTILRRVRWS